MAKHKSKLIQNIYYMLSYAFEDVTPSTYEDIATEEFDNAQDLFAAILGNGIGKQLKQGLYREYQNCCEDLPVLRGKLNMQGTIRHIFARRQLLSCEYDELSENNLYNQILKTTVMLLLKSNQVDDEHKDILKKEMLYFSNIDTVGPNLIAWSDMRFHRHNQTYRLLIGICQFVLEDMLLTEESGETRLASFEDSQGLPRLFEKFVLEYFKQTYQWIHVRSEKIKWALDDDNKEMLPEMRSDIMLSCRDQILIIDTKFYSRTTQNYYGTKKIRSGNLYQIFAYVKNKEAELAKVPHTLSGMLLYARTNEEIQPDNTYQMSGNRIDVKTIDLNRDFNDICSQLNDFVTEFFESNTDAS